jgi:hypothetical protein
MSDQPALLTWFSDRPLPACIPDPAIVLGGTRLLREFLGFVASRSDGGRLLVATPFFSPAVVTREAAWRCMPHDRIDLVLTVSRPDDARQAWCALCDYPWGSVWISVHRKLHAKLYTFLDASGQGGACLVGSHNMSLSGSQSNEEAGVLYVSARNGEVAQMVRACGTRTLDLAWSAVPVFDSRHIGSNAA